MSEKENKIILPGHYEAKSIVEELLKRCVDVDSAFVNSREAKTELFSIYKGQLLECYEKTLSQAVKVRNNKEAFDAQLDLLEYIEKEFKNIREYTCD